MSRIASDRTASHRTVEQWLADDSKDYGSDGIGSRHPDVELSQTSIAEC